MRRELLEHFYDVISPPCGLVSSKHSSAQDGFWIAW
jgi:hypothetical protein